MSLFAQSMTRLKDLKERHRLLKDTIVDAYGATILYSYGVHTYGLHSYGLFKNTIVDAYGSEYPNYRHYQSFSF